MPAVLSDAAMFALAYVNKCRKCRAVGGCCRVGSSGDFAEVTMFDFRDLRLALAEVAQVAGTIFLVIVVAALPFLLVGVGLNAELVGLLALIGLPIFAGAALVAILLCGAFLAWLPIRRLRPPATGPKGRPVAGGVWDREFDGGPVPEDELG